jgi:hypothetical protein
MGHPAAVQRVHKGRQSFLNSGPELLRRGIPVYAPCEHRAECGTHILDVAGRKHKKDGPPARSGSPAVSRHETNPWDRSRSYAALISFMRRSASSRNSGASVATLSG